MNGDWQKILPLSPGRLHTKEEKIQILMKSRKTCAFKFSKFEAMCVCRFLVPENGELA